MDEQWRTALKNYGFDADGTPEEVIAKIAKNFQKTDWRWREEIAKYIPVIQAMSFVGPQATIKWLMSRVNIKDSSVQ